MATFRDLAIFVAIFLRKGLQLMPPQILRSAQDHGPMGRVTRACCHGRRTHRTANFSPVVL
jgi:hypothetical protein